MVFINHCNKNQTKCEGKAVSKNSEKAIFQYVSVVTQLADIFARDNDYESTEDVMRICLNLGRDVCRVVKLTLGFPRPKYSHNSYSRYDDEYDDWC